MLAYRVHRVATSFIRTRKEEASKEKGRIEAGEATQRPSIPRPALNMTRLSVPGRERGTQCVQMDFTRTFQTNDKCNNINHV